MCLSNIIVCLVIREVHALYHALSCICSGWSLHSTQDLHTMMGLCGFWTHTLGAIHICSVGVYHLILQSSLGNHISALACMSDMTAPARNVVVVLNLPGSTLALCTLVNVFMNSPVCLETPSAVGSPNDFFRPDKSIMEIHPESFDSTGESDWHCWITLTGLKFMQHTGCLS